jgi:CheY-like chemotaxis protein
MAKKTILVVDDQQDAIDFVKAVIDDTGDFRVVTASDGEAGLAKAKAEVPDLIVLDVMMPRKNGFTVFAELREQPKTKAVPVIMLTGVSKETGIRFSREDMGEFIGNEPIAFLDKPVDPKKLADTIRKVFPSSPCGCCASGKKK